MKAEPQENGIVVLEIEDISKTYQMGSTSVHALRGVSLTACQGDYIAITGTSGSGKSSLLHIIGCLDTPSGGRYLLGGMSVKNLPDEELSVLRNRMIGFVFQSYFLMPQFSVVENIAFPLLYRGVEQQKREALVAEVLAKVGLTERAMHKSHELSGGERQRVAVARALVGKPRVLLADEPTGNLDHKTGDEIMDLFDALNQDGVTIVMVTHDLEKAGRAHKIYEMHDGLISSRQQPI